MLSVRQDRVSRVQVNCYTWAVAHLENRVGGYVHLGFLTINCYTWAVAHLENRVGGYVHLGFLTMNTPVASD